MKDEFKKPWIKALRSTKYSQARGMLCDDKGGRCCLGVAQDIFNLTQDEGGDELLDGPSARKLGITRAQQDLLATLNDGSRHSPSIVRTAKAMGIDKLPPEGAPRTFRQIANFIEKYL